MLVRDNKKVDQVRIIREVSEGNALEMSAPRAFLHKKYT
jgi:hypothetical protein